jgi:hypothetical protein
MPNGKGKEHMVEQNCSPYGQKMKKKRPGSHNAFQGHTPKNLKTSH